MILGDTCTRRCGFCNVKTGKPTWNDPLEPLRVAAARSRRWACATRSSRASTATTCPTYGATAFVGVIRSIRRQAPDCKVEVLTPDFRGEEMPLAQGHRRAPRRLQPQRRGRAAAVPARAPRLAASSARCRVLRNAKEMGGDEVVTKSGLMVGLGETHEEMVEAFGALREHGVQVLTVGQYLRPTERHLPVVRYWHPDEFAALEARGLRARLRPHRRRPARALELPRRPARPAVAARARRRRCAAARVAAAPCSRSRTTSRRAASRSSRSR